MEETYTEKKSGLRNKAIVAVAIVAAAVVGASAVTMLSDKSEPDNQTIKYATEAKVMLDQASLQAAMDEAMKNAEDSNIGLRYKNNAYSDDGVNFKCYIVNSESNKYDMFLTIFADIDMTDQLFMSGLVPPGSGFEEVTLDRTLEKGDHTVYVALTQVDTDEDGQQTLKGQVTHTIVFHVS